MKGSASWSQTLTSPNVNTLLSTVLPIQGEGVPALINYVDTSGSGGVARRQ